MEKLVRVQVVFDDRNLLSSSQRLEGLKRSWILLKPGMVTISDIASLLRKRFNLKCSGPDGLLLYMDNFVLPPFESTCLLKDKDIIRVRKKDVPLPLVDVIDTGNDRHCIEDSGVMVGQFMHSSQELLAITEFQEESGLCRSRKEKHSSPCNEQTIQTKSASSEKTKSKRKRKHSDSALDQKGKKMKLFNSEIPIDNTRLDANIHSGETGGSSLREKHSNGDERSNALIISQMENTAQKMHSHEPKEAKRKKSKLNRPEKSNVASENADKIEPNQSCYEKGESSQKSLQRKHKISTKDGSSIMPIDCVLDCRISKLPSSVPTEERKGKPKENNVCDPHANCSSTKVQSRNSRWQKTRKRWLKGIIKSLKNKDIQRDHLPNDTHKKSTERQEKFLTSKTEENIVPFVVWPGAEQSLCPSQEAMETVQWNGTSNNKGQKWGRENNFGKASDANRYKKHSKRNPDAVGWKINGKPSAEGWKSNEKSNVGSWGSSGKSIAEGLGKDSAEGWKSNEKSISDDGWPTNGKSIAEGLGKDSAGGWKSYEKSISDGWPSNGKSAAGMKSKGKFILEKGKTGDCCIDFESLFPSTRLPQKGDLLVYKLFELSSSWRPEVTSFRVGKVSSYDPISMRIILVPVPEYPIFRHEDVNGEDSTNQVNASAYKEDCSLEVHYPSLVDVRLLKANTGEASIAERDGREMVAIEATSANKWDQALANKNDKVIGTLSVTTTTGGQRVWGQIKLAISEKKAQVQKNNGWDGWTHSKTTATSSWPHRALRGTATGPTLASLRGRNRNSGYKK